MVAPPFYTSVGFALPLLLVTYEAFLHNVTYTISYSLEILTWQNSTVIKLGLSTLFLALLGTYHSLTFVVIAMEKMKVKLSRESEDYTVYYLDSYGFALPCD